MRRCDNYTSQRKCDDCDLAYPNPYAEVTVYCEVAGKVVTNTEIDNPLKTKPCFGQYHAAPPCPTCSIVVGCLEEKGE